MRYLLYAAVFVATLAWITVALRATRQEPFLVQAAVTVGGALVLRGILALLFRVFPRLRREWYGSRPGEDAGDHRANV